MVSEVVSGLLYLCKSWFVYTCTKKLGTDNYYNLLFFTVIKVVTLHNKNLICQHLQNYPILIHVYCMFMSNFFLQHNNNYHESLSTVSKFYPSSMVQDHHLDTLLPLTSSLWRWMDQLEAALVSYHRTQAVVLPSLKMEFTQWGWPKPIRLETQPQCHLSYVGKLKLLCAPVTLFINLYSKHFHYEV